MIGANNSFSTNQARTSQVMAERQLSHPLPPQVAIGEHGMPSVPSGAIGRASQPQSNCVDMQYDNGDGSDGGAGGSRLPKCVACRNVIKERYLLKALDQLWHEDCLKCACCDCRLGEVRRFKTLLTLLLLISL